MPWSKAVSLPASLPAKSHGRKVEEIQVPILTPLCASCEWWLPPGWQASCLPECTQLLQIGSYRVWRFEIKMVQGVLSWIWHLRTMGLLKGSLCG